MPEMTSDLTWVAMLLPFAAALLAPWLTTRLGANAAWVLALAPALAFAHFAGLLPEIAAGERVTGGYAWVPSINLSFSWFLDGLSLTFALLITGIGALIVLYAGGYMKDHPQQGRFIGFILLFMGAMLGLVVSDSFLMLFVFWELTSITSFLLIGFDHEREASRRAALQALVVTGGGGLILLAGMIFIWNITGVSQLSLLLSTGDALRESPFYLAALLLVLGGAFTKSAQFPFHFWLPNAMEAPTPVSAYLHSATMVKAGVYLLMRLNPVMGETPAWEILLPFFGGITLLVGGILAVRQTDLKLMLAYTTVASLGLLVMLTGFDTPYAVEAAVLYLVAHSLFKGALFMVAGAIDHEAGTRDITKLGGLGRLMPITFAAAILAGISMAGLPPLFGFLAKEEIYAALAGTSPRAILFTAVAVIGNALMFVIAFAVGLKPFIGRETETPKHAHEGPVLLWLGPLTLAVLSLAGALFSTTAHRLVSSPMATAVDGETQSVTISLVPHVGAALALSVLTVILGVILYLGFDRLRAAVDRLVTGLGLSPDRGFDHAVSGLVRLSSLITRFVQNGRLETYITLSFVFVAAVLLVTPVVYGELPTDFRLPSQVDFYDMAVLVIAVIGVMAVLTARDRLTAIVCLGIQGFAVAVIFLLYGAPDLSFTQFMVETLSVVILALVMTRLRLAVSDHRPLMAGLLDGSLALACGLGFALMLVASTSGPFDGTLSAFFAEHSKIIAHGANVVNVIIVDFRGVDTLGEIAVVMITGLSILALIRIRVAPRPAPVSAPVEVKLEPAPPAPASSKAKGAKRR
jgi:multicomponent Na+:H+ antiporter subunit A